MADDDQNRREVPGDEFVPHPVEPAAPPPPPPRPRPRAENEVDEEDFIPAPEFLERLDEEEEAASDDDIMGRVASAAERGRQRGLRPVMRRGLRVARWALLASLVSIVLALLLTTALRMIHQGFEFGRVWGWTVVACWSLAALSAGALAARELSLYLGLRRFEGFRRLAARAIEEGLNEEQRTTFYEEVRRFHTYLSDYSTGLNPQALAELGSACDRNDPPAEVCRLLASKVLKPLDDRVYAMVTREAFLVAGLVSISPFAALDTVWVLLRGLGMIRKVAAIYRVRAGTLGTLRLVRRVFGTALYVNLSQIAVSGIGGSLAGRVIEQVGLATAQGLTTGALFIWVGLAVQREVRPVPFSDAHHQAGVMGTLWRGLRKLLLRGREKDAPKA